MDGDITKMALTASASILTTLGAICKYFLGSIKSLDAKITNLSDTISKLDKNLAVQAAIFEQHMCTHQSKGGFIDGHYRNKETD